MTRSMLSQLSAAFAVLTLLAGPALAQEPVAILPSTGLWWSPGENGQFLQVDIGPGGYTFATLSDGAADGRPSYSVMQGQLESGDASRPGDPLATLTSPRYQIDNSGCLDCGPGHGQTRQISPLLALRFRDGTHAELLGNSGVIRRYEVFPLYTRAADQSSERYAQQQFLLTTYADGTRQLARVALRAIGLGSGSSDCGISGEFGVRSYEFVFVDDPYGSDPVTQRFASARLQIGAGANPQVDLKALVPEYSRYCFGPVGYCATQPITLRPTGRQLCRSIYTMHEVGTGLRGAAPPGSGATVSYPPNEIAPGTNTGGIALLPLPDPSMATGIAPSRGLWWSAGENGQFMQLDIGPGGYAMATLSESAADGAPTYQVMQGQLQLGDAARADNPLARLDSALYRIVGSGCLDCGPGAGRTVGAGASASLQFIDGTHAVLAGPNGVIRRYQRFPLYTRTVDQTSERVAGKRFALSAKIAGTQRTEVVRLQAIAADPRCDSPGLERARNYQLVFERDPASMLAQAFATARLQIALGDNPAIDLKAIVPEILRACGSRPVGLPCGGPTGREFCRSIYRMQEVDADFRGVAPPGSGIVMPVPDTVTPARFSGAISLQALPGN